MVSSFIHYFNEPFIGWLWVSSLEVSEEDSVRCDTQLVLPQGAFSVEGRREKAMGKLMGHMRAIV